VGKQLVDDGQLASKQKKTVTVNIMPWLIPLMFSDTHGG